MQRHPFPNYQSLRPDAGPRLSLDGKDAIIEQLIVEIGSEDLTALLELAFGSASISLTSIRQGLSGSRVFKAEVERDTEGPQISQVIKIGRKSDLDSEYDNWETFAEHYLQRFPALIKKAVFKDWAILDYRFEGDTTLGDYLRVCRKDNNVPRGRSALEAVSKYFRQLHKTSIRAVLCNLVVDEYPLKPEYFTHFHLRRADLEEPARAQNLAPFLPLSLAAPYWQAPARVFETRTHAGHGDLHADNVILDRDNNYLPCAIDFGHCKHSLHFLKDYIALESDLAFRVLAPDSWMLREELESFRTALRILHSEFQIEAAQFRGASTTVRALVDWTRCVRDEAWKDMEQDARHIPEYFLGLLRYAISRTGQPENRLARSQRWIAGHAANVLEQHLRPLCARVHVHFDITPKPALRRTDKEDISKMPAVSKDTSEYELISRYIDELNSLVTFKTRLSVNSVLKRWIAEYIFTIYGTRMFREKARHLFFESGSSIAYLAIEINAQLARLKETLDLKTFSIETNNIFACLEFALKSQIQVSLFPSGPPEQKYGATFGPLAGMLEYEIPENLNWLPQLEPDDESRLEPIKEHFARTYRENGIIFMTASGVEFSETGFSGPHVGSYSNMQFKRILLGAKCPTMIVLDQEKIPAPFKFGSCYPVCHGELTWENVCEEVPLAIAIGLSEVGRAQTIKAHLNKLGFETIHQGRENETPTGIILSNAKFEARFPSRAQRG